MAAIQHQQLAKRDNQGYAIPPAAIIVVVLLAAGLLVAIGFAVSSRLTGAGDPDDYVPRVASQDNYMREVRTRNMRELLGQSVNGFGRGKRKVMGRPGGGVGGGGKAREGETDSDSKVSTPY